MKVYLVGTFDAYERSDILGIFSSEEKAKEVAYGEIVEFELDDYCQYHGNLKWQVILDPTFTDIKYHSPEQPFSCSAYSSPINITDKESKPNGESCCGRIIYTCVKFAKTYNEAIDKALKDYNEMIKK